MAETDYQRSIGQGFASQPAVLRILDANLDRSREGLRIIEEWCRFGLNQRALTEECKQLRQLIAQWHSDEIRAARNTPQDPGTDLTHPQEQVRSSVAQVLQANFCRVQEALRVLEEYGKIVSPEMGEACKQIRYRVYSLESQLTEHLSSHRRLQKLLQSRLYLITSPVENLLDVVEASLQGGVTLVQYRDKTADDLTRLHTAKALKELCHRYDALFVINDRIDLAIAVDADGVHLGQQDVPVALARQLLGSQKIVGRSTHSPDDLDRAMREGVDYVGVGPVYETPTKAGRAAAGLDYVRHAVNHATLPWFAIGGIDLENLHEVLSAGAERIAVVRAIMQSEQPTLATQFFISQLNRQQTLHSIHTRFRSNESIN
ncbi:thiamine phosphate synthase [Egbenema bharatensis]|uniref:thiamine phosphate synthase n=1 Tax=Egbenema bharatensis TaxID=3463334 RepID=UPI003A8993F6